MNISPSTQDVTVRLVLFGQEYSSVEIHADDLQVSCQVALNPLPHGPRRKAHRRRPVSQ
jgi:hypothetical protein